MKKLILAVVALGTFATLGGCANTGNGSSASNEPQVDDKSYITGSRIGRRERPPEATPVTKMNREDLERSPMQPTPVPAGAGN